MRIYQVNYAHARHGSNWSSKRVAVRGWANDAIKKANLTFDVKRWKGALRVESVELLAST